MHTYTNKCDGKDHHPYKQFLQGKAQSLINYEQNHAYFAPLRDTNQRVINNVKVVLISVFYVVSYTQDTCYSLCLQEQVIQRCNCLTNEQLMTPSMREGYLFCAHMNYSDFTVTSERMTCAEETLQDTGKPPRRRRHQP